MTLAAWRDHLLERDWLPDWVVRAGIRGILRQRLRSEAQLQRKAQFIRTLRDAPIAIAAEAANTQHYEVPAAFFAGVLGPHLKYSACLWNSEQATLAEAEEAMLALTVERAGIRDGQRVLELGCGWGSLTLYMATRFPTATIVGVSNSHTQRGFIEREVARLGLSNVRIITADMNSFSPDSSGVGGSFDRIVSVEMFEHMRNYERLMARLAGWLTADGALFVHIFAHREFAYPYEAEGASDWMAEHFFTGGTMPSEDLLPSFRDALHVEAQWRVNGRHYARTCEAWLHNMDEKRTDIDAVLAATYGSLEVTRWRARWRTFFLACAELFRFGDGDEWFVAHYRFRKSGADTRGRLPDMRVHWHTH